MATHQGPHLNINEDLVDADIGNFLFMVIDGFGGSAIGDRAAEIIKDSIKRSYTKIAIDPEATLPFYFSHKYLIEGNALINAFKSAHQSVTRDNESKNFESRGGGSVIAGAISENILTIVSTGNCTAYLYRKGHLTHEILPDSLMSLSRDMFQNYFHSIPMSGIGLFEDLHYSVRELKLREGDTIVFLSDGAYSRLNIEELKYMVEKFRDQEDMLLKEIFAMSNERGNLDNQSGLVLQF